MSELAIIPMQELAKTLSVSALIPAALHNKTPDVLAVMLTGQELGLGPMQSLRAIQIIKGKPTLSADLMGALCRQRRDICEYIKLVESTALVARYETKRAGDPSPTPMSFTIEQAKTAGLTGDNWQKYPAAMLRARALSALCRAVYPDLILGLYDPEELGGVVTPLPTPMAATAVLDPIEPAAVTQIKDALAKTIGATTLETKPVAKTEQAPLFDPPPPTDADFQGSDDGYVTGTSRWPPKPPKATSTSGITAWYDDKKKNRFKKGQAIEAIPSDGLESLLWLLQNGESKPQYADLDKQRAAAIGAELQRRSTQ